MGTLSDVKTLNDSLSHTHKKNMKLFLFEKPRAPEMVSEAHLRVPNVEGVSAVLGWRKAHNVKSFPMGSLGKEKTALEAGFEA